MRRHQRRTSQSRRNAVSNDPFAASDAPGNFPRLPVFFRGAAVSDTRARAFSLVPRPKRGPASLVHCCDVTGVPGLCRQRKTRGGAQWSIPRITSPVGGSRQRASCHTRLVLKKKPSPGAVFATAARALSRRVNFVSVPRARVGSCGHSTQRDAIWCLKHGALESPSRNPRRSMT